jgi:hypothetical protein
MQTFATSPQSPSSGALRMRRARERRRQGDVIVSLEVGPKVTADLVDRGWLPGADRGDKDALTRALVDLIQRAIELRVSPTTGSEGKISFLCDIQRTTIETLVALRWLRADQRDDLAAIVTAFPTRRRYRYHPSA